MTKTATLSTWCLWLALIMMKSVESFSSGAPHYVCQDMTPCHGDPSLPDSFPYIISLSPDKAMPGDIVTVTVSTKRSDVLIMGLMAIVQDRNDNLMSGLLPPDNLWLLDCTWSMGTLVSDSGVTHKQRLNTQSQTFRWTVPSQAVHGSQYIVRITVVKDFNTVWVGINTTLTVDTTTPNRSSAMTPGPRGENSSTTAAPADKVVSEPDDKGAREEESDIAASGAKANEMPAWWSRWFGICYIKAISAGLLLVS